MVASEKGNTHTVNMLMEAGADVNQQSSDQVRSVTEHAPRAMLKYLKFWWIFSLVVRLGGRRS